MPWKSHGQQLRCIDFQLTVIAVGGTPGFRILNEKAEDTLAARRESEAERQSGSNESDLPSAQIMGDRRNKTYYPDGCHPAKEIEIINRITFKTKDEAENAGYKPPKSCQ